MNASPYIAQKLNGASLPTPEAAKAMKTAIGSAQALAKLRSDPDAEAEEAAQAKADAAAAKAAAKPVKGAPAAAKEPQAAPQITISKANGQTKVNDDPFPPSSYAHMPAEYAARAITKAGVDAGTVKFPSGHRAGTQARIQGERNLMAQIGAEAPGLPIADLTARLEGRTDREDAKAYREHLKTTFPQAAAVFDKYLSDGAIENLWPRKKAPAKTSS